MEETECISPYLVQSVKLVYFLIFTFLVLLLFLLSHFYFLIFTFSLLLSHFCFLIFTFLVLILFLLSHFYFLIFTFLFLLSHFYFFILLSHFLLSHFYFLIFNFSALLSQFYFLIDPFGWGMLEVILTPTTSTLYGLLQISTHIYTSQILNILHTLLLIQFLSF